MYYVKMWPRHHGRQIGKLCTRVGARRYAWCYYAGVMIVVKIQDDHDDGFRYLHSCIESGSM